MKPQPARFASKRRTIRAAGARRRWQCTVEDLEPRQLLATLAFAKPLLSATAGSPLGEVDVTVSGGAKVPVTVSLYANPGGAELTGGVTNVAAGGKAAFKDLKILGGTPGASFSLVATAPGSAPVLSKPFLVQAGPAALYFATGPTAGVAGANLSPANAPITVQVLKADGTIAAGDNSSIVTLFVVNNPGGARFVDSTGKPAANPSIKVVNGVATFAGVYLDKAGSGLTLGATAQATDVGVKNATSNPFALQAAVPAGLVFLAQPGFARDNSPINEDGYTPPFNKPGVSVQVVDQFGNPTTSNGTMVTISKAAGPGTIQGTLTVPSVNGVAAFDRLIVNGPGNGYQFAAAAPGLTGATSSSFNDAVANALGLKILNLPTQAVPVGGRLPAIKVQVIDTTNNNVLSNAAGIPVTLTPAGDLYGVTTVTTDATGIATFNNVYVKSVTLPASGPENLQLGVKFAALGGAIGPFNVPLTYGKAAQLIFQTNGTGVIPIDNATAGDYLTAGGAPIQVLVEDAAGNVVKNDTSTIAVGVNRAAPNSETTMLGNGPVAGSPGTLFVNATAKAVNGVATFAQLYINRASTAYQLAAGDMNLALSTYTTAPFDVARGAASKIGFVFQPTNVQAGSDRTIPGDGGVITLAVTDRVGNVDVEDNSARITMSLNVPAGNPGMATLMGQTTVTVRKGIAVFDALYVNQPASPMAPFQGYSLTATGGDPGVKDFPPVTSTNTFSVANPPSVPIPTVFKLASGPPATVAANSTFSLSYQVNHVVTRTSGHLKLGEGVDYSKDALITLTLEGDTYQARPDNGAVLQQNGGNLTLFPTYNAATGVNTATFNGLFIATPGTYRIRAVELVGSKVVSSAVFNVTAAAAGGSLRAAAAKPAVAVKDTPAVVPLDLGSYTTNFDYVTNPKNFPTYSIQPNGSPQPISQQFRPPSAAVPADQVAPMVQPNVTVQDKAGDPHFTQVPETSKFWSSEIFQRTTAVGVDQRNATGQRVFPITVDPLTAMVNTADAQSPAKFAGLGVGYPTHLFVTPVPKFSDSLNTQPSPTFPGNAAFSYLYGGNGGTAADQRLFQDFAVGLPDVPLGPANPQNDATVLKYSPWTVTLDWAHRLDATLTEGSPFVDFVVSHINPSGGQAIELATEQQARFKTTTVLAFDASGNAVTSGSGPLRLEFKYTVNQTEPGSSKEFPVSVDDNYGLFLPYGVTWKLTGGTLTANLATGQGYFSTALLPASTDVNATFNQFRERAYSFVTGSSVNYSFDQDSGALTTTYALHTLPMESPADKAAHGLIDNDPIQALYANQYQVLAAGTPLIKDPDGKTLLGYTSARGTMALFDGPVFVTKLQHQGVLPLVPPMPQAASGDASLWQTYLLPYLRSVSSVAPSDGSLVLDKLLPEGSNDYFDFQSMFGAAQLIPILQEVSQSSDPGLSAADKALAGSTAQLVFTLVKGRMAGWLTADDDQAIELLYYQPNVLQEAQAKGIGWQALLSLKPGFLSSEDINDQQLISGYLLKTAALLSQYDPNWGDTRTVINGGKTTLAGKFGEIVGMIVRNVSDFNASDPQFPFLRNLDAYQGHSWVDGSANSDLGNNQESSSESLNYASALIQWGEATGNRAYRDLGVYLYDTEVNAVDTDYFNIKGTAAGVFPTAFTTNTNPPPAGDNRPNISTLWNASGRYQGYVGNIPSGLLGIQVLPLNGASYYLGSDPAFVQRAYNQAVTQVTQADGIPFRPTSYLSVIDPYLALADPAKALQLYTSNLDKIAPVNPGLPIDNVPFNVHWIQTLQAYGQVDTTVTANTVSYTVFIKKPGDPTTRTFVAYNAGPLPQTVVFKDAKGVVVETMTVAPRTEQVATATNQDVAHQTSPDYAVQAPLNRLFFGPTRGGNGNYNFLVGQTGTGAQAVSIQGLTAPGSFPNPNNPTTFQLTGLTGTLSSTTALASFKLWLDPLFATNDKTPPIIRVNISYDPTGSNPATDPNVVVHQYSNIVLSNNPGYTLGVVSGGDPGGLIGAIQPFPGSFTNGSITVQVWAFQGNTNAIHLLTNAVGEQGRVSYLDVPYTFTQIGGQPVSALKLGTHAIVPPTTGVVTPKGPLRVASASPARVG